MVAKNEHPEKYGWWLNELESLGVSPKVCNELNDMQEVSNLTEILKADILPAVSCEFFYTMGYAYVEKNTTGN